MKIIYKLMLGFLLIVSLLWLALYFSISSSQKALQASISENTTAFAHEVLDQIDREIYYRTERWLSYADSNPRLNETIIKSNMEFHGMDDRAEYIDKMDRDWKEGRDTQFIKSILNNKLSKRLKKRSEFYTRDNGVDVFPEIFVTNMYGVIVASTGRTSDYLQADEEWYQKAVTEKEFRVGGVKYDESSDSYASKIVINLHGSGGEHIGILAIVFNVDEIINIIEEFERGEGHGGMELKLLTEDYRLIYSTEDFTPLEELPALHVALFGKRDSNLHRDVAVSNRSQEGDKALLYSHVHSHGYRDFKGLGWLLLVTHDIAEIFSPIESLRERMLIISAVLTLFAILISIQISRTISRPVEKLKDAAVDIGEGNLDRRIEKISNDEIGDLASVFNAMSSNLKTTTVSRDCLEDEVEVRKRTEKELEEKTLDLDERIKELGCLYGITKLMTSETTLDEILHKSVKLLPPSWQYPDIACARIIFDNREYKTDNFHQSTWGLSARIVVAGEEDGTVELFYLERVPGSDSDPFLVDERNLIATVAQQLGVIIERKFAEIRLKSSMDELERSNNELQQFAYVASHDLQEPLRMVASYVQLLARRYRGKLDADADDFIDYAVDGAKRMQGLINDLLQYSRIGTQGKEFEATECEAVLDRALSNLQMSIKESGAKVTHDLLPTVMADSSQLTQLFQNLIGNAIKFCRDEPAEIHIWAEEIEAESESRVRSWYRFSVRDNGIGIDPKHSERIFLIFQRLHGKGEYAGTGIGLAICTRIVERHGGRLWVESGEGEGATFHFTIPVGPVA